MKHPIGYWIYDNAELFRYIGELPCMIEKTERILLSGPCSAFLSTTMRALYEDAQIVAVTDRSDVIEAVKEEDGSVVCVDTPFDKFSGSSFDIAVSVLAINTLDTRELTPYLFSLHDSLADGGFLFLSFPSSSTISPYPKKLVDSWYSMDEKIYMKRYTPEDVVMALSIIGFDVRAIESDDNPDLGKVVSIHAQKRAVKPL